MLFLIIKADPVFQENFLIKVLVVFTRYYMVACEKMAARNSGFI